MENNNKKNIVIHDLKGDKKALKELLEKSKIVLLTNQNLSNEKIKNK